jgi:hypothetical protein
LHHREREQRQQPADHHELGNGCAVVVAQASQHGLEVEHARDGLLEYVASTTLYEALRGLLARHASEMS